MNDERHPALKRSVAMRLLTAVFSLYVVIAITLTAIQMTAEYYNAKSDISENLRDIQDMIAPSISTALWDLDHRLLREEAKGVVKLPEVGGILIKDEEGKTLIEEGIVVKEKQNHVRLSFHSSAPAIYFHQNNEEVVGSISIFAKENALFDRLALTYLILIVNALLKTLVLWAIFFFFAKRILEHPLNKITEAINSLDLDQPQACNITLPSKNGDELSSLSDAFNNMSLRLKQQNLELRELNQGLDLKVRKKTEQLQLRNAELQKANERLDEISTKDALTGWRNRRFLDEHAPSEVSIVSRTYRAWLGTQCAGAKPVLSDLLFFVVDIDHFKLINDEYGHDAGDQVLKQFCDRVAKIFRESDYLIRWGGEEFLIVARYMDRGLSGKLADRICHSISNKKFEVSYSQISVTCSVGYACFPFDVYDPEALDWHDIIALADKALYATKSSGRNGWVGISSMEGKNAHLNLNDILENTEQLLVENAIKTESSMPSKSIVWR